MAAGLNLELSRRSRGILPLFCRCKKQNRKKKCLFHINTKEWKVGKPKWRATLGDISNGPLWKTCLVPLSCFGLKISLRKLSLCVRRERLCIQRYCGMVQRYYASLECRLSETGRVAAYCVELITALFSAPVDGACFDIVTAERFRGCSRLLDNPPGNSQLASSRWLTFPSVYPAEPRCCEHGHCML